MTRAEMLAEVDRARKVNACAEALDWFTAAINGERSEISFRGTWLEWLGNHSKLMPDFLRLVEEAYQDQLAPIDDTYWACLKLIDDAYWACLKFIDGNPEVERKPIDEAYRTLLLVMDEAYPAKCEPLYEATAELVWQAIQDEIRETK